MKALVINGSPNANGNSTQISNQFSTKLKAERNIVDTVNLNEMNIKGCQECFLCRKNKSDRCYFNDELSLSLEKAKSTDLLLLSTPIFFGDISAQLKMFIDRTWSYFGNTGVSANHLPRNRALVFVITYGYENKNVYDHLFENYKKYFAMYGFTRQFFIKGYGAQYFNNVIVNQKEVDESINNILKQGS